MFDLFSVWPNFRLQISPSMLLCCPAGVLRSPISQISITEPKRTSQGSFMPLINLQNKTCCESFWTCSEHRWGIKWDVAAFDHALEEALCPLDLTVPFTLSERRRRGVRVARRRQANRQRRRQMIRDDRRKRRTEGTNETWELGVRTREKVAY